LQASLAHAHRLPADHRHNPDESVRSSTFSELENNHEVWTGLRCSVRGGGAVEGGHSESDRGWGAGAAVDLGELVFGAGEADLESFGFAGPAFVAGFCDAGGEVVADLSGTVALGRAGPVESASQSALTKMILSWDASLPGSLA
jgi:hypothetical protein